MDRVTTAVPEESVAALEPFGTLPDWVAAVMRSGRLEESLRRHVPELGGGGPTLLGAETDQLRATGGRWLVRCVLQVADPDGGSSREVVLVGELHPPDRQPPLARPRRGQAFGDRGWTAWLPDLRLELTPEEGDVALPSLGDLVDPLASARLIEGMLHDGAYPAARVATSAPTVARYKPGSRCTIVYDITYDPPSSQLPNPVIAKIHQGEKGIRSHEAMTSLWATRLSAGEDVLLAEPLAYRADERIQLQGPVPEERTLKDLCHAAFESGDPVLLDELRVQLTATARALAALHGSGAALREEVTFAEELAAARELVDDLAVSVPELRGWAEPTLALLATGSGAVAPDPQVSSHNSFSTAQVLLGAGPPAFIDFDSAAMGEPAMDVGRFRAGLRCVGVPALGKHPAGYREDLLAARLTLMDDVCDRFLADYEQWAPVTAERVVLWEVLDLTVSLLHTWTKGRIEKVGPRLATLKHALTDPRLPGVLPAGQRSTMSDEGTASR